jgi:hypothetical protein
VSDRTPLSTPVLAECHRCRSYVAQRIISVRRDRAGVRWARWRCDAGHEWEQTVTRQTYAAAAAALGEPANEATP